MSNKDQVIKHLEIVQGVTNRLASNSFLIKGWSMTILAAAILFIGRNDGVYSEYLVLVFLIPVVGFWVLDGYFLWQEKLFRGVYDDVRLQETTNFEMTIRAQKKKPNNRQWNSLFSITLLLFYGIEAFLLAAVFIILKCS